MSDVSILVFAFKDTIAEKIARELETSAAIRIVDSSKHAIDELVRHIQQRDYDYILGMGMYSGRDQDQLRIEKECSSQFRNDKDDLEYLAHPYFMKPDESIKEATGIGNSWCNLASYKVMKKISPKHFTFLHIPKTFNINKAAKLIDKQLAMLR
jgi:pyrrolidone-carboxylate peptidase